MSDEFSRSLAHTAVGQLAELAGFESVQESACDILSELLIKYITELAATSQGYAELANRTGSNLYDVILALDDLGTTIEELQGYLSNISPEDNTFAHAIPEYPIRKPARGLPTWQDKQEQPPAHIPAFLPAFPDKHTYMATPTYPGHEANPDKQAKMSQKARKQAEASLLKLHHATTAASKSEAAAKRNTGPKSFLDPPAEAVIPLPPGVPVPGTTPAPASTAAASVDTAQVVEGTGAYEPHAASKAFAAVLPPQEGQAGQQGEAGGGMDDDELMAPEELNWKYQARLDETGALQHPLGTSVDYTSVAFSAAQTYTTGQVEADAYEEAVKEEAVTVGATGHTRKRKSQYGQVVDPTRRKAQDVMSKAKDPTSAMEGEEG